MADLNEPTEEQVIDHKVYNCSDCDYCETVGKAHICVNGYSDYLGEEVDWLGLAEDDMDCVIVNGKDRD